MARPSKRTIYERIKTVEDEILNKEKEISELNKVLQDLFEEQKQEEMLRLYEKMISSNLTIEDALQKIDSSCKEDDKNKPSQDKLKRKKEHTKNINNQASCLDIESMPE